MDKSVGAWRRHPKVIIHAWAHSFVSCWEMGSEWLEVRGQRSEVSHGSPLDWLEPCEGASLSVPKVGCMKLHHSRIWTWTYSPGSGGVLTRHCTALERVGSSVSTIKQIFGSYSCSRLMPRILEPLWFWSPWSQRGLQIPSLEALTCLSLNMGVQGSCTPQEFQELLEMCVCSGFWRAPACSDLYTGESRRLALKISSEIILSVD